LKDRQGKLRTKSEDTDRRWTNCIRDQIVPDSKSITRETLPRGRSKG